MSSTSSLHPSSNPIRVVWKERSDGSYGATITLPDDEDYVRLFRAKTRTRKWFAYTREVEGHDNQIAMANTCEGAFREAENTIRRLIWMKYHLDVEFTRAPLPRLKATGLSNVYSDNSHLFDTKEWNDDRH